MDELQELLSSMLEEKCSFSMLSSGDLKITLNNNNYIIIGKYSYEIEYVHFDGLYEKLHRYINVINRFLKNNDESIDALFVVYNWGG